MDQPEVFECIYGLFTHILRWSRQMASGLWHVTVTVFRHIIVTTQLVIPYQHLLNYLICNIFLVISIHLIYGCIFHICTSSFINELPQAVACLVLKGNVQYTLLMTPDVTTPSM